VNSILFKFAVDNGLYGSEYAAMKVAGHELKGMMSYADCQVPGLGLPMMALVDFMGFRLIAMTLLPLAKGSLIYGTADAGKHMHADPAFCELMAVTAERLNLVPHICGDGTGVRLYSAADIEGHLGSDGRHYLYVLVHIFFYVCVSANIFSLSLSCRLDFSRTMPPTMPDPAIRQGHLYRLFRPEAVRAFEKPLCPDAYSGFIRPDPERAAYNLHVREATAWLLTKVVPPAAKSIQYGIVEAIGLDRVESYPLALDFHRHGINLRYIGYVIRWMIDNDGSKDAAYFLLIEAIARVVKNGLRRRLRRKMATLQMPLLAPYHKLIIYYLNHVFGDSAGDEDFSGGASSSERHNTTRSAWRGILHWLSTSFYILPADIVRLFADKLQMSGDSVNVSATLRSVMARRFEPASGQPPHDARLASASAGRSRMGGVMALARSQTAVSGRYLLFRRVEKLASLKFRGAVARRFRSGGSLNDQFTPFHELDLLKHTVRVKHTGPVATAEAIYCLTQALSGVADTSTSIELLTRSREHLLDALTSAPSDPRLLFYSARVCNRLVELSPKEYRTADAEIIEVDNYFLQSIDAFRKAPGYADGEHPALNEVYLIYARFLSKCGRLDRAEDHYLRSLEADPTYERGLSDYASFLIEHLHDRFKGNASVGADVDALNRRASQIRAHRAAAHKQHEQQQQQQQQHS
jgi:tetratricopeptide (TPR) repeat protein